MENQLHQLARFGQSVWLDNIRRSMFASGELRRSIGLGLRGMTSNPTIFEKAIGSGSDYDEQLRSLAGKHNDPDAVFEELAVWDIQHALDEFRSVYDANDGGDGFVSIEVSPLLAHDTQGTIAMAKHLWQRVDRPNLMVKIPATREGIPAIAESIAAGININVTLVFSIESYEAAARAYIAGLQKRAATGLPIDRINSANSVFVSRIDTAVDKLLDEKIAKGENLAPLLGKTGIANLKLTYQKYLELFESPEFEALKSKGARVQRPLWASTSTKNPKYDDLMYVKTVVAKNTINTMPPNTLEALLDHGAIEPDTVLQDVEGARAHMAALANAKISLFDVTQKLQVEGVSAFADSFAAMLGAIVYKQRALASGSKPRVAFALGEMQAAADSTLAQLDGAQFLKKLWSKDPTAWSTDPAHEQIIKNALGWLDIAGHMLECLPELRSFADEVAGEFADVVVLGMGGSSLAPDVLRSTFGEVEGRPRLHILDSTDPMQIKTLEDSLEIERTLFIVASKSGTTTEPDAFFRYFFDKVQKRIGGTKAPSRFVAITDPGTKLDSEATAERFRRVFHNAPDIGGRYSALSLFGMVPAAIAGYDIDRLLDRALGAMHANDKTVASKDAPGVRFGAALGALAKLGRDKLTIIAHPQISAFGKWAEQLIAESTGKSGTGIVPVEGENLGEPQVYGSDRVFVYAGDGLGEQPEIDSRLSALEAAGQPLIRLAMSDRYDLGEQFFLWEVATAAAGSVLAIDAFDQPNVQESKDNTVRLLQEFAQRGRFAEPAAAIESDGIALSWLSGSAIGGGDPSEALASLLAEMQPGDYAAITAYIAMDANNENALQALRLKIRDARRVATTLGFGPRFLHSTGQLHKGGPPSGVFMQITGDTPTDLPVPGMPSFGTLLRAQALGDFQALDKRHRRGVRVHLRGDIASGLKALAETLENALSARA